MSKIKIEIKSISGSILFEHESRNNSIKETLLKAANEGADLVGANLRGANLEDADLRGANLEGANLEDADLVGANLRGANLVGADLRGANLRGANLEGANLVGANLRGANLRGANLEDADLRGANLRGAKKIPQSYVNTCSRDILYILRSLRSEVPRLKESLLNGKINGSQYEGECACLVGTLSNKGDVNEVCERIKFYEKGLYNPGEQWFYQINEGDTPENSFFAKHAVELCDIVLNES